MDDIVENIQLYIDNTQSVLARALEVTRRAMAVNKSPQFVARQLKEWLSDVKALRVLYGRDAVQADCMAWALKDINDNAWEQAEKQAMWNTIAKHYIEKVEEGVVCRN